jgi:hypothetical protein
MRDSSWPPWSLRLLAAASLVASGVFAACSSTSDATGTSSPLCADLASCEGYRSCCNGVTLGDDCYYVDPSGNKVSMLPTSCADASTDPNPAPPQDTDAAPWLPTDFVGTWNMVSGSGQSQCGDGPVETQLANPSEVDVLTQTGPDTLTWFERSGCQQITLQFNGDTAVAAPGAQCTASEDGYTFDLTFSSLTFTLVVPGAGNPVDAAADGEAGAGEEGGGAPAIPSQMTIDLIDWTTVSGTVCGLTAHYLLERAQ